MVAIKAFEKVVSFVRVLLPMMSKDVVPSVNTLLPKLASEVQPVRSMVRSDVAPSKALSPIDVMVVTPPRSTLAREVVR